MDYEDLLKRAKAATPIPHTSERFEIPVPYVQKLKKQTVVKNFSEIAKRLRRDEGHLAKFLFRELAVPGSISDGALSLQGKISSSMIKKRIEEYAREFVICEECGKPDTTMKKDGKIVVIKCEACGAMRSRGTL